MHRLRAAASTMRSAGTGALLAALLAVGPVVSVSNGQVQIRTTADLSADGIATAAGRPRSMPRVIITEIMYDPASDERRGQSEWVEIANLSDEAVRIVDWLLDDEDTRPSDQWGPFSCVLLPGQVAVLINGDETNEEEFRAAWDDHESAAAPPYLVIPVKWGGLANNPSATNEILVLRNGDGDIVCEVNFQSGNGWPRLGGVGGPSIYLVDLHANELNDGALWRASVAGDDGARLVRPTEVFNGPDVGSPGRLPTRKPAAADAAPTAEAGAAS